MVRDFRAYLQNEFSRRLAANSQYSLRAYARALDIAPSALSAILNNKRPLTDKAIQRLAPKVGVSPQVAQKYLQSKSRPPAYQHLADDEYEVLSSGIHNALLELIKTKDFDGREETMAKRLGVPPTEIKIALQRLERLKVLDRSGGIWRDLTNGFTSRLKENYTDAARRAMQVSLLEKSIAAVKEVPIELRNHTSMTFAINPADLPEAVEKIKKFRREMDRYFDAAEEKGEVYQLSVSLFPLTKPLKGKKK
jgi:uncharacterized protein (TIGR02147 family)